MDFKDKVVLITGSSGDIGSAIALELAKQGAKLCLQFNNNTKQAKSTKEQILSLGGSASVFQANLFEPDETHKLIASVNKEYGQLDVLVNCIGDFLMKPLSQLTQKEFRNIIESNVSIAFDLCQSSLPLIRKSNKADKGKILNFGYANAAIIDAKPGILPYHIAKLGLILLTKSFAKEEAKNNVLVNCLSPGTVESSKYWPGFDTILGRPIKVPEIVEAALFLLKSDYLTGMNLEIDGGWKEKIIN